MAKYELKTSLYLDSRDKTGGDVNDYYVTLPRPIRATGYQVKTLEIPFSYYTVNSTNNVLTWEDNVPNTYSATLTAGNYTGSQLATEVQTKMNAQMAGFTVSYDSKTYKLSWSNASQFKLLAGGNTTADEVVGLSADGTLATSDVSDNAINLSGTHYLMIRSDELSKGRPQNINSTKMTSYIHRVSIEESVGDIITEQRHPNEFRFQSPIVLKRIDVALYDDNDVLVDLNGLHWSMQLDIWELV